MLKISIIFIIERLPLNNTINIKIKLLNENAKVPAKKHDLDIGYDLFSDNEYLLKAQSVTMVHPWYFN